MFSESFAGTLWYWWRQSAVFALLRHIYRFFRAAWYQSVTRRILTHPSRIQAMYGSGCFSLAIRRLLDAVTGVLRRIFRRFGRFNAGGVNYRLWQRCGPSSVILKYDFLLGAFLALMFLCPHDRWNNAYALLGTLGLLLLYLCKCAMEERSMLDPTALGLPLLLFAAACFLSLAFSRAFSDSVRVLIFFLTAFLLCWLTAASVRDRKSLMSLLGFLYAAVVLTGCYALLQRFMGVKVDLSYTDVTVNRGVPGRVYSTLDNPNNYAEFLVMMTPLAAVWAVQCRAKLGDLPLAPFLCFGLGIPLLAMVMTYSRGGWIATVVAVAVLMYYADKRALPLLLIAGIAGTPFLPRSVVTRLTTLVSGGDTSTGYRALIWTGVARLLRDHGLTGIGLGPLSFAKVYAVYALEEARIGVPHSHMQWLEVATETGLFGIFSFVWLFLSLVRRCACGAARARSEARRLTLCGCIGAIVGIGFQFVGEYTFFYPRNLFAFFLLCGVALGLLQTRDEDLA